MIEPSIIEDNREPGASTRHDAITTTAIHRLGLRFNSMLDEIVFGHLTATFRFNMYSDD